MSKRRPPTIKHLPNFVYFVECEGYVKIGVSNSPRYRAHSFSTSNPFDCRLIGLLEGPRDLERRMHARFASFKHRNEWYVLTDELRSEIAELCGDWQALDMQVQSKSVYWRQVELDQKYRQSGTVVPDLTA